MNTQIVKTKNDIFGQGNKKTFTQNKLKSSVGYHLRISYE